MDFQVSQPHKTRVLCHLRLGLGLGPGIALGVHFFSSSVISVVNTCVFVGSVSVRQITYEYSIDDVTTTWILVNLVSP